MAKRRPPPKKDDKPKPKRRLTPSRAVTSAEIETHTEPVAKPGHVPSPGENVTVVFDVGEAMGWAGGGAVDVPTGKRSRKPGGDK